MLLRCALFLFCSFSLVAASGDAPTDPEAKESYTINYNTVPIMEYLRFASKICKVNFIYDETELNFNVTVVSDEPITPKNVMATLLQVLRIHGLLLLEQGNNLVIHKSPDVVQVATLVTGPEQEDNAPILTRVFRVKQAKPDSVAAVIRPMISKSAILETSPDTRQIILTDITANVDKIAKLIESLDSPQANLEIQIYDAKSNTPEFLVTIATEIMSKITTGDPFSMVPQNLSNKIYIISTPELDKKAIDLLTSLDVPPQQNLEAEVEGKQPKTYFLYKLQYVEGDVVEEELENLAKDFKATGFNDKNVITVIQNLRYIKETNSLLLTGEPKAVDEVKALIAQYDYAREPQTSTSNFFLYKPLHVSADQLLKSLHDIATNLKKAKLADPNLLNSIETAKYVESTNSIIFTGNSDSLQKIQALIKDVDVASASQNASIQRIGKSTFLLYKLKVANGQKVIASLKTLSADLKKSGNADKELLSAINSAKYIPDTNSILFTGAEDALNKIQPLVEKFDVKGLGVEKIELPAGMAMGAPSNYFVYKPQAISGPDLERILVDFAQTLQASGLSDPDLFNTISTMKWMDNTQSLIFTGTPKSLEEVKGLLKEFDVPSGGAATVTVGGGIQEIDNTSFLVYKLQFHKGDEIQNALRQIAKDLSISHAPINQNLLNSINSIQWLEVTNSILCTGDQETLTRLRELIKNLDIPLKQVYIEMLVLQTSMSNVLNFGLQWGANYKFRDNFSSTMSNTPPPLGQNSYTPTNPLNALGSLTPASPVPNTTTNFLPSSGTGQFDLGIIGEVIRHNGNTYLTLGSLMQALQQNNEITIVMTPKIITQDGRTSTIFQGSNIPFAGSFVSNTSTSAGNPFTIGTTNIEYRDIGINLTVTPVLGNSDIVTLDITLDQSSTSVNAQNQQITFNNTGVPTNINGITTSKVAMQTTVHVPNNHFLILSGMTNNSNSKTKTGIPCLGGLPLIGAAFSTDNDTFVNTNTVIFLRPHILNSLEDMTKITKKEEEFFRDQAATPFLEHNFDEGMELIKSVDDE